MSDDADRTSVDPPSISIVEIVQAVLVIAFSMMDRGLRILSTSTNVSAIAP